MDQLPLVSGRLQPFRLEPPLVSIVLSNYNYGRFLRDAVESVFSQTYQPLECILVDDCSTDDSGRIITALQHEWPQLNVIRMPVNSGQSGCIVEGFSAARGEYILFLDADDVLFPECIARHLALHMSTRRPVGFSCCDAIQIVDGRAVVARNINLSTGFRSLPCDETLVSPSAISCLAAHGIELAPVPPDRVRHVPWTNTDWPWTTTSSMFFRRDALEMIIGAAGLRKMRLNTDAFFAHAINHLTGSLILDEQLVGYRIHGCNGYNRRAPLDGFFCHDALGDDHNDRICAMIIDDFLERFAHYSRNMTYPERVLEICELIDRPDPAASPSDWTAQSRFAGALQRNRAALEQALGADVVDGWMARLRATYEGHSEARTGGKLRMWLSGLLDVVRDRDRASVRQTTAATHLAGKEPPEPRRVEHRAGVL